MGFRFFVFILLCFSNHFAFCKDEFNEQLIEKFWKGGYSMLVRRLSSPGLNKKKLKQYIKLRAMYASQFSKYPIDAEDFILSQEPEADAKRTRDNIVFELKLLSSKKKFNFKPKKSLKDLICLLDERRIDDKEYK